MIASVLPAKQTYHQLNMPDPIFVYVAPDPKHQILEIMESIPAVQRAELVMYILGLGSIPKALIREERFYINQLIP